MTSYEVLDALEKGRMSLDEAVDTGVLAILGTGAGEVTEALGLAYGIDLAMK